MLTFIDKHYEKITWFIIALGFIFIFTAREYLSIVVLSFLVIKAIKFRDTIRDTIRKTPLHKQIIHVGMLIVLIAVLTIIILASASFIKEHNIPVFLRYVYIAVLLLVAIFCYNWITDFLVKMWGKRKQLK